MIDNLKIEGGCEIANPYLEKMMKFYLSKKGNVYSFLKTLNNNELKNLSECYESQNEDWKTIVTVLSTMAFSTY